RSTLLQAIGLVTLVIGVQRVLPTDNTLLLLVSAVLGSVIGELLRIEARLEGLGNLAAQLLGRSRRPSLVATPQGELIDEGAGVIAGGAVAGGFVTASLIFCVGPMTILGSFEDGLFGAYQTLALKATLDGITATILAATMGWGVLLAAVTVLVFQGALTLGAG